MTFCSEQPDELEPDTGVGACDEDDAFVFRSFGHVGIQSDYNDVDEHVRE